MKRIPLLAVLACAAFRLHAGIASWYGDECKGKPTANGELFDPNGLTCASWHYPFGTKLKVTNVATGESVIVRVNDRGPNKRLKREIDLSRKAFSQIAPLTKGLVEVKVEKVLTKN